MVDEESKREIELGKVGKSLNESKRKEESRNERVREWGGLKANHVASRGGSRTSVRNEWRNRDGGGGLQRSAESECLEPHITATRAS